MGTTSIEVKSGYGLDTVTELRMLEAYARMKEKFADMSMHITWMGAHDIPSEMTRKEYVDSLLTNQLPAVLEQGFADSVDVFCEPGWFTIEDTVQICDAAVAGGLSVRLHVDEFVDGGWTRQQNSVPVQPITQSILMMMHVPRRRLPAQYRDSCPAHPMY